MKFSLGPYLLQKSGYLVPSKVPIPRVDRDFFRRPRHNSTAKIVDRDIFQHYYTAKKCGIVSNNVE